LTPSESVNGEILRITTAGRIRIFHVPSGHLPYGIVAGPDGALWMADVADNSIMRMTTAGRHRSYRLPTPDDSPDRIVAGPDGALWFTRTFGIGRITTSGEITELSVRKARDTSTVQQGIVAGPDGAMWFTQKTKNRRGRDSGQIGRIDLPGSGSQILVATLAPGPYRGTGGRRISVNYTSTQPALGALELRRGGRRLTPSRIRARAGENVAELRLPRGPGRYDLRLRVGAQGQAATDTTVLTITR
jgi:streptogramin lyase